jgi:virulence factor Mce-like protein
MNPDAKVKMRGVQVGTVESIEELPDGRAALHLAMDPGQLPMIPDNVHVDITSSTVFGAKFVDLVPAADPSPTPLAAGMVLDTDHVTVELNTVFQQLSKTLSKVDPAKLNATLGALSSTMSGRSAKFGQALTDFDHYLAEVEPSLPNLTRELQTLPGVVNAYADAAPDLLHTADNATRFSETTVDEQQNLDTLLIASIGLADSGNQVIGGNRQPITDVLHLLVPTTELLAQYRESLDCSLKGMLRLAQIPPLPLPGAVVSAGFVLGPERYRYPSSLPKVAASGAPLCLGLPAIQPNTKAPFVVTDVGANPFQYGNQGILLNADGLKQFLFGPLDGPPRNVAQIGQPG